MARMGRKRGRKREGQMIICEGRGFYAVASI